MPTTTLDPDFEWIGTTTRSSAANTKATREDEISHRAFLMARLGFPKKVTEQRLSQNLAWEYERVGRATVDKRVGALVGAAYKRAGIGRKK